MSVPYSAATSPAAAAGPGRKPRPYGVLGVFLVILGAGVILDADRTSVGWLAMVAGAACLVVESRQAGPRP